MSEERRDVAADGGHERGEQPSLLEETRTTLGHWRPYVTVVGLAYLAVVLAGAVLGHDGESSVLPVRSAGETLPALDPLTLFVHDVQAVGLLVVGVLFVLPTAALLAYDAFVLGASVASATASFGPLATLSILLPHALFELPAMWLAGAIALRWGHVVYQTIREDDERLPANRVIFESAIALLVIVVALAIAALIEATITKDLVSGLV